MNNKNHFKIKGVLFGKDHENAYIKYRKDIRDDEKIIGLCSSLLEEYYVLNEYIYSDEFKGVLDIYEDKLIPIYLSKEKPKEKYHISNDELSAMIIRKFEQYGDNLKEIDVSRIIKHRNFTNVVTGRYFSFCYDKDNGPYIELYYLNFDVDNYEEYFLELVMTLAHEYLHYVHDVHAHKLFCGSSSFTEDAIKEGLADFFSVIYMVHKDDKIAESIASSRVEKWMTYFGSRWPYAEALWFFYLDSWYYYRDNYDQYLGDGGFIDKFVSVFQDSESDVFKAYKNLIMSVFLFS